MPTPSNKWGTASCSVAMHRSTSGRQTEHFETGCAGNGTDRRNVFLGAVVDSRRCYAAFTAEIRANLDVKWVVELEEILRKCIRAGNPGTLAAALDLRLGTAAAFWTIIAPSASLLKPPARIIGLPNIEAQVALSFAGPACGQWLISAHQHLTSRPTRPPSATLSCFFKKVAWSE